MHISTEAKELAIGLLRHAVSQIENETIRNRFTVRNVGGICRLLGHEDLVERCTKILAEPPESDYLQFAITNIPRSTSMPASLREIDSLEQLDKDHPPCTNDSIAEYIRQCGREQNSLRLAADKRYSEAFDACRCERELEEVASTQAVLGDIDAALESAMTVVKPDMRANGVRFVCTLELFRRGKFEAAKGLVNSQNPNRCSADGAARYALIIYQRLPWLGYPFPD